jgi:8-oxo-dGTP pyrophosphatase MutT (NUDIX family)
MDEVVALVSPDGSVTGSAPRSVVRRENLLHASTAVLVRNSAGQIYVHRRSPDKDWAPSHHDAAAGGIIAYGEEPLPSALRELAEELGIHGAELRSLGLSVFEDDTTRCVEHVFETVWDGPIDFADEEVVWGAWLTLPELGALLRDPEWPFVPDTRLLLEGLVSRAVGDYARLHD